MSDHPLEAVLHPRSIAIAGASGSGRGGGFLSPLLELGFKGDLYPVNPKYDEIMGLKAYARITDIPGPVDYVISSIPATSILDLIDDCVEKKVKGMHLFTARFSETGREDAAELERELLRRAQAGGVRLIGPNCLGLYYPEQKIAFNEGMPPESGRVGVASQSGQVAGEIVGLAAMRGVRFSKAISYGNALDFSEADYLEYYAQDDQTDIILMYIEGVRDGRNFLKALRETVKVKPVILLKGGRGSAGTRATASHTASMAGSQKIWQAMVSQTGAISVSSIDEMIDLAVGFYFTPPITGRNVAVAGGGGGSSVQAADHCEEAGLNVIPLPERIRDQLKAESSPIWDWISNPADFSIAMEDPKTTNQIMKIMAQDPDFDLFIFFMMIPWRQSKEPFSVDRHMKHWDLKSVSDKPMMVVFSDRPRGKEDKAEWFKNVSSGIYDRLLELGYAVYPNIRRASEAANKIVAYYERKQNTSSD